LGWVAGSSFGQWSQASFLQLPEQGQGRVRYIHLEPQTDLLQKLECQIELHTFFAAFKFTGKHRADASGSSRIVKTHTLRLSRGAQQHPKFSNRCHG
jgi:hypothetical protein